MYLRKTNLERDFTKAEQHLVTGCVQGDVGEAGAENNFQISPEKNMEESNNY